MGASEGVLFSGVWSSESTSWTSMVGEIGLVGIGGRGWSTVERASPASTALVVVGRVGRGRQPTAGFFSYLMLIPVATNAEEAGFGRVGEVLSLLSMHLSLGIEKLRGMPPLLR